jgi:hypothetical protein
MAGLRPRAQMLVITLSSPVPPDALPAGLQTTAMKDSVEKPRRPSVLVSVHNLNRSLIDGVQKTRRWLEQP